MSKRQYGMLIVVALVAGLIGGIGAGWVLTRRLIFVQPGSQPAKVIQAEKFEASDEIKAKRIVIVDDAGKPRISLGEGEVAYEINLLNEAGGKIASLFAHVNGTRGLVLYDIKGDEHARLVAYSNPVWDFSSFVLRGEVKELEPKTLGMIAGQEQIELKVESDRPDEITLKEREQQGLYLPKSSASLSLRADRVGANFWLDGKEASLDFNNYAGPPPAGVSDVQKGTLNLKMSDGRPTLTLSDNLAMAPALVLGNTSLEHTRTGSEEKRSAASLVLFGKAGKVIWEAP